MHFLLYYVILCSLQNINVAIQAFNTLQLVQKHQQCCTDLATHLTNTQACFDLFCIVCLPRFLRSCLCALVVLSVQESCTFTVVVYKVISLSGILEEQYHSAKIAPVYILQEHGQLFTIK
jgi:hypothetical protein